LIKKEPKSIRELTEERFLAVAFKYNPNILLESEVKDLIKTPLAKRIFDEFILFMKKNKNFDPSLFAGALPKELVEGFTSLVLKEIAELKDDVPESYDKEIKLIRNSLAVNNVKEKGKKLTEKLISAEKAGDKRKLKKGQEEFNKFTLELKKLEEKQ